jgi:hypothetical protein
MKSNTIIGNLCKMNTNLIGKVPQYSLVMKDVLTPLEPILVNDLIGQTLRFEYSGYLNSILSGEKMLKAYGEGLTYKEWTTSPWASPSIMRPELSEIHNGIALRDYDWEVENHLQPHTVYISFTGNYKVGVTREANLPYRWIDQGATQAIALAKVPYRQLAGLIEVSLKGFISDKTSWQGMLKGVVNAADDGKNIIQVRNEMGALVPSELQQYLSDTDVITEIEYPIEKYPVKVKSRKLEKERVIEQKLVGIKGQYLIFDDGSVLNVRSHSGFRVSLEY